jgi:hypothetical protein
MKPNWIYPALLTLALLIFAVGTDACRQSPAPPRQSKWNLLPKGDYLREDYIRALCESRSALLTWHKVGAETYRGLDQITIGGTAKNISIFAGYNFHEGSGEIRPENDGTLHLGEVIYSMDIDGKDSFQLSDGKSTVHFRYVGDWQLWADRSVIAGSYKDAKGSKYVFGNDGVAHFPGNRSFDYKIGLDEVLTDYDYIYSDQLKSTWAVRLTPRGIALYDVDENQNELDGLVATNPKWRLTQLTPISCQ